MYIYNSFYGVLKPLDTCISFEIQKTERNWLGIIYFKINKYCTYKEGGWYSFEFTKEEIIRDLKRKLINYIKRNQYKDILLLKEV